MEEVRKCLQDMLSRFTDEDTIRAVKQGSDRGHAGPAHSCTRCEH